MQAPSRTWLKASVIAIDQSGFLFWTQRRVRFRFLEVCPYDFFKAAIEGFTREVQYRDSVFPGFNSRHWR